jgi:hypothetical protein
VVVLGAQPVTADYYPVLARAVSGLPNNSAEARQELYAQARAIIIEQFRRQDGDMPSPRAVHERAALENAIRRIEAESQPIPPDQESLAKILAALETRERSGGPRKPAYAGVNGVKTRAGAASRDAAVVRLRKTNKAGDLGALPNWLGVMFFGITYTVAAVACIGLVYVRGSVWVAKGTIGYPILLIAILALLSFFVVLPRFVLRKRSGEDSPDSAATLRRRR